MAWRPTIVQTRGYWREAVIGILVVLVLGLSFATCRYSRSGVSRNSQQTIDSLKITAPAFDSSRAATLTNERAHVATATSHAATVTRLTSGAQREHIAADSLVRLALNSVNDAIKWRDAYYARTREADSLRAAIDTANLRAESERSARIEADRRAALDSARHVAIANLALNLERDAHKAANCRILVVIPCATRTQVAVVSIITTAAATTYVLAGRKR